MNFNEAIGIACLILLAMGVLYGVLWGAVSLVFWLASVLAGAVFFALMFVAAVLMFATIIYFIENS